MLQWAAADLAAAAACATTKWLIAVYHHPAYARGAHNSDADVNSAEMRAFAGPMLEAAGVDVVLSGHLHIYERTRLMRGHFGNSSTFNACTHVVNNGSGDPTRDGPYVKPTGFVPNAGTVYVVAGSGGQLDPKGASELHPAMYVGIAQHGSLVVDVSGDTLTARFLSSSGVVGDTFSIAKRDGYVPAAPPCARSVRGRVATA